MNSTRFYLAISARDYQTYYAGKARSVSVTTDDGRRIEFPAEHLCQFVSHDGIRGYFEIEFDREFRFRNLRRLA